jgi:hypothetical protein
MKQKLIISAVLILFANLPIAVAQMDPAAKDAILTLLLSKPVSEKIFVNYPEGTWIGAFGLPGGNYVFIPPNRILRSVYPTILNEMPYTISTDSLLNMRTLYRDSIHGVFISQTASFRLFTVFEEIELHLDSACIKFITTSQRDKEQYRDKYIAVKSKMIRTGDRWSIVELDIEPRPWTDYFK